MKATIAMLLLVSCGAEDAASVQRVRGPDGSSRWFEIECEDGRSACVKQAGETCGSAGYTVGDSDNYSSGHRNPDRHGYMLIRCN